MDIVTQALHFAADAFAGMRRKGDGSPAVLHSVEAAAIAASMTNNDEVIAAAALHDTVEDTGKSLDEIERLFGKRVAQLVAAETEDKHREMTAAESWRMRKQATIDELNECGDTDVKIIALADKLSNLRSFYTLKQHCGSDMWQRFNQRDPHEHRWYFAGIAASMPELSDTLAYKEYMHLLAAVFDGVEL